MSSSKSEKQKMATIAEVYNRIIWDGRLNRNLFIAGFHERISDRIREKPLVQWEINGDIPWHRIRYIRCGDLVVWDREQHLDLISSNQLPATAWKLADGELSDNDLAALISNNQVEFRSRSIYQHQSGNWQVSKPASTNFNLNDLKILTYNVLCNLYEPKNIATEKRLPAVINELKQTDADIIALEEVTPELVELLLLESWIKNYFVSESMPANNVKPYGNLLMSRFPFTLVEHQFSGHKRSLIGTWHFNEELFHVAVVHLTSDRAENAKQKRTEQLATVVAHLQEQLGTCLIVGDFNTRGNEQEEILKYAGFADVWQQLHPDKDGYTFDPHRNSLAVIMSLEGKPARFDRIFLRQNSQSASYKPQAIAMFGCQPIPGTEGKIYPSDHFGICAVLQVSNKPNSHKNIDLTTVSPVYQSAIVIIPPQEVLPAIQSIRQRYDARFERWMPHINLIYGFLPASYFESSLPIIASALAKLKPFQVTLADFQTFTHRKSTTAWLRPVVEPQKALHELQSVLQSLFPQCDEQSNRSDAGFTPHLSVGQFANSAVALSQLPAWHPVSFTVDAVALISRRGDEPFEVRYKVLLGEQEKNNESPSNLTELLEIINQLEPELTRSQKLQRQTAIEVVKQACTECLGFESSLHLLGSARLGVESPQSDLDLVCLIPSYMAGDVFLNRVQDCLQGLAEKSQLVLNAKVPALRFQLDGISIDLLYAQVAGDRTSQMENLLDLKSQIAIETRVNIVTENGDFSPNLKSLIGCWESDLIANLVKSYADFNLFSLLLRAIKSWAKARCIYGNSWGFLGGFSWTLLTAYTCTRVRAASPKENRQIQPSLPELLANFFEVLSQYDWSQPLSLTDAGKQYQRQLPRDWLPVVTSIAPCQNTARNVTRSTAKIIQQELARGAAISARALTGEESWKQLFEPPNLAALSDLFVVITATSQSPEELEKAKGTLAGYIVGLAIQLEQLNIFVRPSSAIARIENCLQVVLGLTLPDDPQLDKIERVVKDFESQLGSNFAIRLER
jgi:poly(A) polymerase